jgi:feruloyl esterase
MSNVKIEVWMPTANWNGKLEGVGNSGLAGSISYTSLPSYVDRASLVDAIQSGYAAVSTDTGHVASDGTWLTIEDKQKDFGYRAIHAMTVAAKAIVRQFYGSSAKHSYFNGCDTGGGQALGQAQLYPEDYDGILAGAPQNFLTHTLAVDISLLQAVDSDPSNKLSTAAVRLVTEAVLKQCGSNNGAPKDGYLSSDPRQCYFGPEQLLCEAGQDPATCLTASQAKLVMKIYEGYIVTSTNQRVMPGLVPGSEAPVGPGIVGWAAGREYLFTGNMDPSSPPAQFYRLGVLQDRNVDLRKVDIDSAVALADKKFEFINHLSTNLDAFVQRGGKLLIYHGWADGSITPLNSINYYSSVVEAVKGKRQLELAEAVKEVQNSVRLFLVPGMGHCGGGPGPDVFDALGALDQWVDGGVTPVKIIASHVTNGAQTFSRPLCPYPQVAQYMRSGDRNNAGMWACMSGRSIEVFDHSFYETPMPTER